MIRPLGVFTSLDAGLGVHLDIAHALRVPTIHLHAPSRKGRTPRDVAEFRERLAKTRIKVSVVFAGFEGESYADIPTTARTVGLAPPATREARLEELKAIADFARALSDESTSFTGGAIPVGLHLGFVPHDPGDSQHLALVEATQAICDHCAPHGQSVHLETGQEPSDVLLRFLGKVDRSNLGVNFDPANMILYGCGEPLPAVRLLGDYVRSVHCKDATWSDKPGETWGCETPLGEGDVDFRAFLGVLDEVGYAGPLTIERETPHDRELQRREISAAIDLLRSIQAG